MGTIETVAGLRTPHARRAHTIRVYRPDAYDRDPSVRLPVIYLCDGQNLFDAGSPAVKPAWGVDVTLDRLVAHGTIEPWLVVGIDHAGAGRVAEYSLWNEPRAGILANGESFVEFLLRDLDPWVRDRWRVRPGRESTALGGSSMGGLVALSVAARAPDRFGRVLAMSPTVMWADEAVHACWSPATLPQPRVYLDAGRGERFRAGSWTADYVRSAESFARHLRSIGFGDDALRLVVDPMGMHHESDWRRRLPDALSWLLR